MKNPKLTTKDIHDLIYNTEASQWSIQHIAEYFFNLGFHNGQEYTKYLEEQRKLDDIW